jgi:hypothetical protein
MNNTVKTMFFLSHFVSYRFKKRLGSRSMSEDSVFQPEVKESKMDAIRRQTAISMEGLDKDFQVCFIYKT